MPEKKKTIENSVVVASLKRSQHPHSAIALSPDKQYAATADKDTLQIVAVGSFGLRPIKSIPMASHFASSSSNRRTMGRIHEERDSLINDSFFGARGQETAPAVNVVITDVAWSMPMKPEASLIAAAGSNGVIVVWSAATLLQPDALLQPEAVLRQHVRAVNRLAWHPKRALLLSASQDATVLLWERRRGADPTASTNHAHRLHRLFGKAAPTPAQFSWQYRAKYEPKSEAVRDIRWSPFYEDVTTSGSLIAYNMHVPPKALLKFAAHSGDATTLDWHPLDPHCVATGGAGDRSVKVWDVSSYLLMERDDANLAVNSNTMTSVGTESSNDTDRSNHSSSFAPGATLRTYSPSSNTFNSGTRHKSSTPKGMLHVLAISASVTRLRWRPPANEGFVSGDGEDRHAAMMAVATAPIKGASAGGAGVLALWSYHRPFMPLSVVQGHKDGAVTDFDWLETPIKDSKSSKRSSKGSKRGERAVHDSSESSNYRGMARIPGSSSHESEAVLFDNIDTENEHKPVGIWQHVISVGRDGRCIIQSFVRGDRPIARVSPSCFAMANLSPFQKGYGSLQLFSVFQPVPSDARSDYFLTGLRRDRVTIAAPGIFREKPIDDSADDNEHSAVKGLLAQKRFPASSPELVFNVVDQGDLDRESKPIESEVSAITVAPEVVHLSRFATLYALYPSDKLPTRVDLCLHNSEVADDLRRGNLGHMWRMLASMLESSGVDGLPQYDPSSPASVMHFAIFPTVRSLLIEMAEDGDVQACVAVCEVLQVVKSDQTVLIPDLDINLVREWYLSYIDLLRDMCLFSHASFLIRSCNDPFIAALNQQSTTIHESCPHCGKPILAGEGTDISENGCGTARRLCKSCRRRIGLCFLCHEPVKGMYVWCPGCGHGGHLDHALQWFGGLSGKAVREVCPTGCGHKCNLMAQISAFPRTESLKEFPIAPDQVIDVLPAGV